MKILNLIMFLFSSSLYAQTIYFGYDAAGNRKYRGTTIDVTNHMRKGDPAIKDSVSLEGHTIKIYPNPTGGKLNISIDNFKLTDQASYTLIDTKGAIVLSQQSITNGNMEADFSSSPVGQYYINVILNDKRTTWKVIKH
jgi:hypothetical protein